jgi:hypothetical protein
MNFSGSRGWLSSLQPLENAVDYLAFLRVHEVVPVLIADHADAS